MPAIIQFVLLLTGIILLFKEGKKEVHDWWCSIRYREDTEISHLKWFYSLKDLIRQGWQLLIDV